MRLNADIIVVGSGVGGATVAKELAERGKKALVIEKGCLYSQKRIGSEFFATCKFYDKHGLWSKTKTGVFYYRAIMVGGTSIVSCANGVRTLENELKHLGIDLSEEFLEVERELDIKPVPDSHIGSGTKRIMEVANRLGFNMEPMPKFINFKRCISCGNCVLGCRTAAKWTALDYLKEAQGKGVSLITGINVTKVLISNGKAIGIEGYSHLRRRMEIFGNIIVLAAGGIGTPIILQNSGIEAGQKLFLDLFNITMGVSKDIGQTKEVTMAAVSHHKGFILSPFIDCTLAFASTVALKHILKIIQRKRLLSIMTKIKDDCEGKVYKDGKVEKNVTAEDLSKLQQGTNISREILVNAGVNPKTIFSTLIRGAHPGGTAAIGDVVDINLKTKIENLFVSDASVLPESPGAPPILTIVALSKRLTKNLK